VNPAILEHKKHLNWLQPNDIDIKTYFDINCCLLLGVFVNSQEHANFAAILMRAFPLYSQNHLSLHNREMVEREKDSPCNDEVFIIFRCDFDGAIKWIQRRSRSRKVQEFNRSCSYRDVLDVEKISCA
jgi:hypothetical protein